MKGPKYILYALMILLGACTSNSTDIEFPDFEETYTLQADTILCNEVLAPDFMQLKGGSLFIASSRSDTMMWQYALPKLTLLSCDGRNYENYFLKYRLPEIK